MNIFRKIRRWFRKRLPPNVHYVDESSFGQLYEEMMVHCPACHAPPSYMEGPSGGISTNVFCSYCGQGYNITPMISIAQEIHKDTDYIVDHIGSWKT